MITLPSVEPLPIVIAAVINVVIGMLWYSPAMFEKKWLKLSKLKKEKNPGKDNFAFWIISAFVLAYVLSHIVALTGAQTATAGAAAGFLTWLLAAAVVVPVYVFESRARGLFWIYAGYQMVSFAVMGAVIAVL